jgi:hypothetical protein
MPNKIPAASDVGPRGPVGGPPVVDPEAFTVVLERTKTLEETQWKTLAEGEDTVAAIQRLEQHAIEALRRGQAAEEVSEQLRGALAQIRTQYASAIKPRVESEVAESVARTFAAVPRSVTAMANGSPHHVPLSFMERLSLMPRTKSVGACTELQDFVDAHHRYVLASVGRAVHRRPTFTEKDRTQRSYDAAKHALMRALNTEVDAEGGFGVEDVLLPGMLDVRELIPHIQDIFVQVDLVTKEVKLNHKTKRAKAHRAPENTEDAGVAIRLSQRTVAQTVFIAKDIADGTVYSYNWEEDSTTERPEDVVADLEMALKNAMADAVLNGEAVATEEDHQDYVAGVPADLSNLVNEDAAVFSGGLDVRILVDGLRAHGLGDAALNTDMSNGNPYFDTIALGLAAMGPYGISPSEVTFTGGFIIHAKLMTLKDNSTDKNLIYGTVAVQGDGAANLTGLMGTIAGRPFIPTELMSQEQNASGVIDDTTVNRTSLIAVNRAEYGFARRGSIQLDSSRHVLMPNRQVFLMGASRFDFKCFRGTPAGTITPLHLFYNLATT